jgi:hypothetical protein
MSLEFDSVCCLFLRNLKTCKFHIPVISVRICFPDIYTPLKISGMIHGEDGADDSEYEVIVVDENNSSVLDHESSTATSIKVRITYFLLLTVTNTNNICVCSKSCCIF